MDQPLVSCLMVTRDRARLARRALRCFAEQTWRNKELVIVDDGDEDYGPMLSPFRADHTVHYHRIDNAEGLRLGGLRNLSLDLAGGAYCCQWDDDEWYHPRRIELQVHAMEAQGLDACVLEQTLMHVDTPRMAAHPYRADAGGGTPGTICHKKTDLRYPDQRRAEDARFLDRLRKEMRVGVVDGPHSHLFIRCYHGDNTWDVAHFAKRLRRTPGKLFHLAVAKLRGDIFSHPSFRLSPEERGAIECFFADSRELGLLDN